MAKRKVEKRRVENTGDDSKLFAFLGIFLPLIGLILALVAKKKNEYVMFYAKQGLILFVACVIASVVSMIPVIGWFILGPICYIIVLVLWIMGIFYSLSGEMKDIPIIGKFARNIKI